MIEPPFQFTQSNLQDYLTCAQRFELRHLHHLNWPAVESAPIQEAERRMQLGSQFHRLIHQHILGMPEENLTALVTETADLVESPELPQMWQHYLTARPEPLLNSDVQLYPEMVLSTMVGQFRLLAKYDLLAFLSGSTPQVMIVDWKTTARRTPSNRLRQQAQSRVYPYVLVKAGQHLNDQHPIDPNTVTMWYWFANDPQQPEIITYSQAQFDQDDHYLTNLISEIATAEIFPLTPDQKACRYCVYRSYCDRGQAAGPLDEFEEDLEMAELTLDWEQIAEIAY
ncbi:MAG: PD-(D/E)XK nuclease family protein [Chloroflexota bacterium]